MNKLSVGSTERKRGKWVQILYYENSCYEEQYFVLGSLGNWEGRNIVMNQKSESLLNLAGHRATARCFNLG